MPWKRPACHIPIRHSEAEDRPRPDSFYRCHICRIELMLNPGTDRLIVAPVRADAPDAKEHGTA